VSLLVYLDDLCIDVQTKVVGRTWAYWFTVWPASVDQWPSLSLTSCSPSPFHSRTRTNSYVESDL